MIIDEIKLITNTWFRGNKMNNGTELIIPYNQHSLQIIDIRRLTKTLKQYFTLSYTKINPLTLRTTLLPLILIPPV